MNYIQSNYPSAYQTIHNYYQQMPHRVGKQMVYSFAVSSLISLVFKNNPRIALIEGGLAVLATGVHALITPLFRNFTQRNHFSVGEEICRTTIASLTASYAGLLFGYTESLQYKSLNIIFNSFIIYFTPERLKADQAAFIIV